MDSIKLYEIDEKYIDYLLPMAPHLFQNKKPGQQNTRKYIGVILIVDEFEYFAPLSSFKDKHRRMQESLDFLKVKQYAVINLNIPYISRGCKAATNKHKREYFKVLNVAAFIDNTTYEGLLNFLAKININLPETFEDVELGNYFTDC